MPHVVHRHGHLNEVWQLLKVMLPEWHLPEPEPVKPLESLCELTKKDGSNSAAAVSVTVFMSPQCSLSFLFVLCFYQSWFCTCMPFFEHLAKMHNSSVICEEFLICRFQFNVHTVYMYVSRAG